MLGRDGRRIIRLHTELEGLLSLRESAWLYRSARGAGRIVEIGSYRGKSFVLMALGSRAGGGPGARITAIDPHLEGEDNPRYGFNGEDRRVLLETAARHGVRDCLHEMVMRSDEAIGRWDGGAIDLLWVDGDHSYEAAKFDIERWGALVRPGGVMAAHDHSRRFPGVQRAWDEAVTASRGWGPTSRVRSLVWATKLG